MVLEDRTLTAMIKMFYAEENSIKRFLFFSELIKNS